MVLKDSTAALNRESHARCGPGVSCSALRLLHAQRVLIARSHSCAHSLTSSLFDVSHFALSQQLYKQRFFVQLLPHLLALLPPHSPATATSNEVTHADSIRYVLLLAMAHLLKHLPHTVILASIQNVSQIRRRQKEASDFQSIV